MAPGESKTGDEREPRVDDGAPGRCIKEKLSVACLLRERALATRVDCRGFQNDDQIRISTKSDLIESDIAIGSGAGVET